MPRLHGVIVGASAAFAVVLVGVPLAWASTAAAARANVHVLLDDRRFECADPLQVTQVATSLGSDDATMLRVPSLLLSPDLDCEFSFVVHNAGDSGVTIDSVRLPFMGPGNGLGLHAALGELGQLSQDHREDIDALFDDEASRDPTAHPIVLAAGDAVRFTVALSWAGGCMGDGTSQTIYDAPTLGITALGFDGTVSPIGPAYAGTGTADSFAAGC